MEKREIFTSDSETSDSEPSDSKNMKACRVCTELFPNTLEHFHKAKNNKLCSRCKKCTKIYYREYIKKRKAGGWKPKPRGSEYWKKRNKMRNLDPVKQRERTKRYYLKKREERRKQREQEN